MRCNVINDRSCFYYCFMMYGTCRSSHILAILSHVHACIHLFMLIGNKNSSCRSSLCQLGDKLTTLSKAHRHDHAHTTTHVAKYILGSVGKDSSCPAGYGYAHANKANRGAAARSAAVAAGANDQNTGWLEGAWGHAPVGCSINKASLTQKSPWRAHWNTESSAENNGHYIVVCERESSKLSCLGVVFVVYLLYVCMYVCM